MDFVAHSETKCSSSPSSHTPSFLFHASPTVIEETPKLICSPCFRRLGSRKIVAGEPEREFVIRREYIAQYFHQILLPHEQVYRKLMASRYACYAFLNPDGKTSCVFFRACRHCITNEAVQKMNHIPQGCTIDEEIRLCHPPH